MRALEFAERMRATEIGTGSVIAEDLGGRVNVRVKAAHCPLGLVTAALAAQLLDCGLRMAAEAQGVEGGDMAGLMVIAFLVSIALAAFLWFGSGKGGRQG